MIKYIDKREVNPTWSKMNLTFTLLAISLISAFTACKKTDDPKVDPVVNPVITVTSPANDGDSKVSGSVHALAFTAQTDNGLKRVVVKYKSSTGTEMTKFDTLLTSQPSSFSFSRNYTIGAVGTETYTITVTDKKDNILTKSVNIKSITGFGEETLGQISHILGSNSGAFDLSKSEQRLNADADAEKDMSNNDATLFTGSWAAKNSSLFVKAPAFNYNSGSVIDAAKAYADGTPNAAVSAPVAGDIYVAKLRGGNTYVLIKVLNNDPLNDECGCANKGKLTFSLKKSI
jgi:hypothetical protein